jgi:hypothetical protein
MGSNPCHAYPCMAHPPYLTLSSVVGRLMHESNEGQVLLRLIEGRRMDDTMVIREGGMPTGGGSGF